MYARCRLSFSSFSACVSFSRFFSRHLRVYARCFASFSARVVALPLPALSLVLPAPLTASTPMVCVTTLDGNESLSATSSCLVIATLDPARGTAPRTHSSRSRAAGTLADRLPEVGASPRAALAARRTTDRARPGRANRPRSRPPLREQLPRARELFFQDLAERLGVDPDLVLRVLRRAQGHEREPTAQVPSRAHARVAADRKVHARKFFWHTHLQRFFVKALIVLVFLSKLGSVKIHYFNRQLFCALDRPRLLRQVPAAHHEALDRRHVVQVRQRRVPRTHIVVTERHTVTVPLSEDEDRSLHLDREPCHLERGRVLVPPEISEKLFITRMPFPLVPSRLCTGAPLVIARWPTFASLSIESMHVADTAFDA